MPPVRPTHRVSAAMLLLAALCVSLPGWLTAQDEGIRVLPGTTIAIPEQLVPPPGEAVKCGFPIISGAIRNSSTTLQGRQAFITQVLARPDLQTSVLRNGVRVHFDTSGTNTPALLDSSGTRISGTARAFVDSIFSMLSYVLPFEAVTLGYGYPPSDDTLGGGPELDIYVLEMGNTYGETTPDQSMIEGGRSSCFMTIDNDFIFVRPVKNRGLGGLRVTLAHELHHVLQIGNYGYWDNDIFFYEITSTWMEDVTYPDVNDYYNYLTASWGHFKNPETPFTSDNMIMYSRAIWGHYVSKKLGRDVMRETWENIRGERPPSAIDRALRAHGMDFGGAFAEWSVWNYFTGKRAKPATYYTDGADYPLIAQAPIDFSGTSRDLSGSLRSFGTHYIEVDHGADTMTVMVSSTDVAGTLLETTPSYAYSLHLRSSKPDDSYKATPIGLYAQLDVADPSIWSTWFISGDTVRPSVDPSLFSTERPFPSPFHPGASQYVYIPTNGTASEQGALYIFSASADLVRSIANLTTTFHLGAQMAAWDGRKDDGSYVPTGIYLFVIDLPGRRLTGKIPVVRE